MTSFIQYTAGTNILQQLYASGLTSDDHTQPKRATIAKMSNIQYCTVARRVV